MKKFYLQVLIGSGSNLLVLFSSLLVSDWILAGTAVVLFVMTWISWWVFTQSSKGWMGIHLMLLSYAVVFSYASFTHLVYLPLMFVCPIILGLASLHFTNKKIRKGYFVICTFALIMLCVNVHLSQFEEFFNAQLISSLTIGVGTMSCFYFIYIINNDKVNRYQRKLRKSEASLQQKNAELEAYIDSNLQLEYFAHLASHELRSPLVNISNFSGLLRKKLGPHLSQGDVEMVKIIENETVRLNHLIDALLQHSLVSGKQLQSSQFMLSDMLNQLVEESFFEQRASIEIRLGTKWILGNYEMLRQLFSNLLENALKFKREGVSPEILIKSYRLDDRVQIEVHDNGIGVDKKFREKVFLIFKKLHTYDKFVGTGIGLSLCKTIAKKHGGDIWIKESELGGACFCVSLPRAKKMKKSVGVGKGLVGGAGA